jgi:hypothetical protein
MSGITIVILELLVISYMIWDTVTWQQRILKTYNASPKKKKVKLKKGQRIAFQEGEYNPFEEV